MKILDTSSLTCPRSFICVFPRLQCISSSVPLLPLSTRSVRKSFRLLLSFSSFLTPYVIIPLFLSSAATASSPLSVTLPLFPARCDQLGDISPRVIPGDRTSGGRALLHLSSFSASPSVSPLHTWLSCHSCSSLPVTPSSPPPIWG